jgi:hypothetical protein
VTGVPCFEGQDHRIFFLAASSLHLPPAPPTSTCNCHCSSLLRHLLSSRPPILGHLFPSRPCFYPDLAPSQLIPATGSAPPASSPLLRSTCHLYLRPPLATATAHLIPATGSAPPASSPLLRFTCNLHLRPPLATATAHPSCVISFLHDRRPATVTAAACSSLPCLPPPPDRAFRDWRPLFWRTRPSHFFSHSRPCFLNLRDPVFLSRCAPFLETACRDVVFLGPLLMTSLTSLFF